MADPAPTILVASDDTELRAAVVRRLIGDGWMVSVTAVGEVTSDDLLRRQPDVVLLDVTLPGTLGLDQCRRWRTDHPAIHFVLLTASSSPVHCELSLSLGADERRSQPFEEHQLADRLRALLQRKPTAAPVSSRAPARVAHLSFGALAVDLLRRHVSVAGQVLPLSRSEFALLLELTRMPGQLVSREHLSGVVQAGNERAVDVQVSRLRRRLAGVQGGDDWIEAIRGEGYAFVPRSADGVAGRLR